MKINNLPPNWSIVKLDDIGKVIAGGTPSTKVKDYFDGKIVWITPADLTGYKHKHISKGRRNISDEGLKNSSARLVPKGSILFSSRAPIGYVAIASNDLCTNQGFKNLIPNNKVNSEFVYYYLKSARQLAEKNASGTTFKEISARNFANLPIPLPPLPEQKKIVEKIEELFSGLESGIAELKKVKEQIKVYRQSVLAAAFSGRLHQDLSDSAISRIKFQNKSSKSLNLVNHGSDNLPEGWKWVKLGEVLEVKDGTHDTPKYKENGIPFITQKNIKDGKFIFNNYNFIAEEDHQKFYKRSNVEYNDIIISMIGANRGMTTIVKTKEIFSIKNVGLVKTNENKFLAKYLDYYFKSKKGQNSILSKSKGGAQQFIGLTELRNWQVPFLQLDQQTQIVQEIEKRFSEADNLEKAVDEGLAKAESLRQSILKRAFEGKLI